MYMGLMGTTRGSGTVLGPVVGGALAASNASWRWAFYINLPLGGIIVPILIFLIPSIDLMKGVSFRERVGRIDAIGCFLQLAFFTLLLVAFSLAGNQFAWNSRVVIDLFLTAGITVFSLF
jgi:MFS family permease